MERIGRYKIVKELGRGAMGIVYKAFDPKIGRTVAVKTIRFGEVEEPERRAKLRERLFREARSAGVLSHPGIVTIYDVEEEQDLAYITMEFVNGPTMEMMLGSGKALTADRLLDILRQTAAALDYAHRKGIVHRDIKPGNIMVSEEGSVRITDFGIAKMTDSENLTRTGNLLGTPNYMSPEQVRGLTVDGATDQFSLAVVAYESLTGERPFPGEHLTTVVYKIVAEEPISPERINPTLGPAIDEVLRKGLAKDPSERYPSCGEFVQALESACKATSGWRSLGRKENSTLPTVMGTTGALGAKVNYVAPAQRYGRAVWRRKLPVAAAMLALACVVLFGWKSGWMHRPARPLPTSKSIPAPPAPSASVQTPAPAPASVPEQPVPSVQPETARSGAQTRDVWVTTDPPNATAMLEDARDTTCQTPCLLPAKPGAHVLSVSLVGFQMERRQVRVGNSSKDVPPIVMQREGGVLALTTTPPGASISIDGRRIPSVTPAEIKLSPGAHRVTVELNGKRATEQVEIANGEMKPVAMALDH